MTYTANDLLPAVLKAAWENEAVAAGPSIVNLANPGSAATALVPLGGTPNLVAGAGTNGSHAARVVTALDAALGTAGWTTEASALVSATGGALTPTGDGSYAMWGWFTQPPFGNSEGGQWLRWDNSNSVYIAHDHQVLQVFEIGGWSFTAGTYNGPGGSFLTNGDKYFVCISFDFSVGGGQCRVKFLLGDNHGNAAAIQTQTVTLVQPVPTGSSRVLLGNSGSMDVDGVGLVHGPLTDAQMTFLYNGGAGREFAVPVPTVSSTQKVYVGQDNNQNWLVIHGTDTDWDNLLGWAENTANFGGSKLLTVAGGNGSATLGPIQVINATTAIVQVFPGTNAAGTTLTFTDHDSAGSPTFTRVIQAAPVQAAGPDLSALKPVAGLGDPNGSKAFPLNFPGYTDAGGGVMRSDPLLAPRYISGGIFQVQEDCTGLVFSGWLHVSRDCTLRMSARTLSEVQAGTPPTALSFDGSPGTTSKLIAGQNIYACDLWTKALSKGDFVVIDVQIEWDEGPMYIGYTGVGQSNGGISGVPNNYFLRAGKLGISNANHTLDTQPEALWGTSAAYPYIGPNVAHGAGVAAGAKALLIEGDSITNQGAGHDGNTWTSYCYNDVCQMTCATSGDQLGLNVNADGSVRDGATNYQELYRRWLARYATDAICAFGHNDVGNGVTAAAYRALIQGWITARKASNPSIRCWIIEIFPTTNYLEDPGNPGHPYDYRTLTEGQQTLNATAYNGAGSKAWVTDALLPYNLDALANFAAWGATGVLDFHDPLSTAVVGGTLSIPGNVHSGVYLRPNESGDGTHFGATSGVEDVGIGSNMPIHIRSEARRVLSFVAPTVSGVSVSPSAPNVAGLATQAFSATVSGTGSPSQAVTWSKVSGVGAIDASTGVYTAPAASSSPQTAIIRATSVLDPSKHGQATITVPALGGLPPSSGGLSVTGHTSTSITLNIGAGSGATNIALHRFTSAGFTPGSGTVIEATIGAGSYTDGGLDPATSYYYKAVYTNAYGSSTSVEVTETTSAGSGGGGETTIVFAYVTLPLAINNLATVRLKAGDTGPARMVQLVDADGRPFVLAGGASVRYRLKKRGTDVLSVNGVAAVVSAQLGIVSYEWVDSIPPAGNYDEEWEVTTDAQAISFPSDGYIPLVISGELG